VLKKLLIFHLDYKSLQFEADLNKKETAQRTKTPFEVSSMRKQKSSIKKKLIY